MIVAMRTYVKYIHYLLNVAHLVRVDLAIVLKND